MTTLHIERHDEPLRHLARHHAEQQLAYVDLAYPDKAPQAYQP